MSIKSTKGIYNILEKYLRAAATRGGGGALTVTALMDIPEVRAAALEEYTADDDVRVATNKLSDALGLMWRRGLLTRYPAPKESNSFARYAYIWDQSEDNKQIVGIPPTRGKLHVDVEKFECTVSEFEGGVLLNFPKFSITIESK